MDLAPSGLFRWLVVQETCFGPGIWSLAWLPREGPLRVVPSSRTSQRQQEAQKRHLPGLVGGTVGTRGPWGALLCFLGQARAALLGLDHCSTDSPSSRAKEPVLQRPAESKNQREDGREAAEVGS